MIAFRNLALPALHLLLATGFLSLAIWSGRWALADFFTFPLEVAEAQMRNPEVTPELREQLWQRMMEHLTRATSLNPGNADLCLHLGRLQYTHGLPNWEKDPEKQQAHLQAAVDYYERATVLRPTWGYSWVNLAQARIRLGREHWSQAAQDLERAMVFAPQEPGVQGGLLPLGFRIWPILDDRIRGDLLSVAHREAEKNPEQAKRVLTLVRRHDLGAEFLPRISGNPTLLRLFRKHVGPLQRFGSAGGDGT
ncbi:MAG: hypothetical protein HQL82_01530 [Magnetococcales bacterium]|nr:hypothetical protein [Magnetococcales bacterium]